MNRKYTGVLPLDHRGVGSIDIAPVDVLAVMDEMYRALPPVKSDGPAFVMNWEMERRQQAYENARAAVAELIDVASQFDSYKSSDFGDTSILDNEDLWNRLSAALSRVKGA